MVFITEDLIRKRAEHNEGQLSNLKEVTLHQQNIEKISVIGSSCKNLEILFLQSNLIPKIEGLHKLKCLQYLNLALNNITKIENLEGCESLEKLDLTANFIENLGDVGTLSGNIKLNELYLTGNPCTNAFDNAEDYRFFVIHLLPQLNCLDGILIERSERIKASQEYVRLKERVKPVFPSEFYNPEVRLRDSNEKAQDSTSTTGNSNAAPAVETKKEIPIFKADGSVLQSNSSGIPFRWEEDNAHIVLEVGVGRYVDTSLIDIDLQPSYVRVWVRAKLLQLALPAEVEPDSKHTSAKRSQATGRLVLRMKRVDNVSHFESPSVATFKPKTEPPPKPKKAAPSSTDLGDAVVGQGGLTNTLQSLGLAANRKGGGEVRLLDRSGTGAVWMREEKPMSAEFVDDPDVPPLE
eukprot:GCRY01004692.1.p1 GENE.GCRY01004692.1~~GCRY01004692.1.p1  ORF type:complete len:408 (+),score=83.49 GCRY01004692.1:267-1490(+)